ncbi:MAG: hypothetical protein OXP75_15840, partial [Rhodospirillales bacterium]|nr:hypothetical protein [Rhodospirillales bacterium]
MERGFAVHTINPQQLDRFSPAGAKDDRWDALRSAMRFLDGSRRRICRVRKSRWASARPDVEWNTLDSLIGVDYARDWRSGCG